MEAEEEVEMAVLEVAVAVVTGEGRMMPGLETVPMQCLP